MKTERRLPDPIPGPILIAILMISGVKQILPYSRVSSVRTLIEDLLASRDISPAEVQLRFAAIEEEIKLREPVANILNALGQIHAHCAKALQRENGRNLS